MHLVGFIIRTFLYIFIDKHYGTLTLKPTALTIENNVQHIFTFILIYVPYIFYYFVL